MARINIRYQKISDAERYFEILNDPGFLYFDVKVSSVEEEREWLEKNPEKREKNQEYNYAVLYDDKLVGACGVVIDQNRPHIGELGYFVDSDYWGKGIATEALKRLERIAFNKLKLVRLEIRMEPENKASQRVAVKCGYLKEGLLKKVYMRDGKYRDCLLYAKVR